MIQKSLSSVIYKFVDITYFNAYFYDVMFKAFSHLILDNLVVFKNIQN